MMNRDQIIAELLVAAVTTGMFGQHEVTLDNATNTLTITLKG